MENIIQLNINKMAKTNPDLKQLSELNYNIDIINSKGDSPNTNDNENNSNGDNENNSSNINKDTLGNTKLSDIKVLNNNKKVNKDEYVVNEQEIVDLQKQIQIKRTDAIRLLKKFKGDLFECVCYFYEGVRSKLDSCCFCYFCIWYPECFYVLSIDEAVLY